MTTNITGTVHSTASKTCPQNHEQLQVNLYRKTLSAKALLQTVAVNPDGLFTISQEFEQGTKYNLCLELVLRQNREETTVIAESGPHCLQEELTIRFTYNPKDHYILWDHLEQSLKPQLGTKKPRKLSQEDISQLTCLGCAELTDIRSWVNAYRYARKAKKTAKKCRSKNKERACEKVDLAPAFFALSDTQTQGELHLARLLTRSESQLKKALWNAVENKRIALSQDQISAYSSALLCLRDCLLFNSEHDGLNHDAKLIHLSSLSHDAKSALLDLALDQGSLVQAMDERDTAPTDPRKALALVSRAVPLTKSRARKRPKKEQDTTQQELEQILFWDGVTRQFAPLLARIIPKLRRKAWGKNILLKYNQPHWTEEISGVAGDTKYPDTYKENTEATASYAHDITLALSDLFPTEKLVSQIEESSLPHKEIFKQLLERNPGFNIQEQAVSRHFTQGEGEEAAIVSETDYKHLQTLQRVLKLAGGVQNVQVAEALWNANITSSVQIVRKGRFEFHEIMQEYQLQNFQIKGIWCRAEATYDLSKEIAIQYTQSASVNTLIPSILQNSTPSPAPELNLPDMETLFGSLDRCSCKHCQSVYSPAAYLTDMLQWLKGDVKCQATGKNGFTELDKRRPDITYILLNCKNTNTVLPYIDLVNEVLLTHLSDYDSIQERDQLLKTFQTNGDTEQLLAEPEHWNQTEFSRTIIPPIPATPIKGAYVKLRENEFPWTLPYDREFDLAQNYLQELEVSYPNLIRDLSHAGAEYDTQQWANAKLGMLSYTHGTAQYPEWDIITGSLTTTDFWETYWGLSAQPGKVGQALEASSLSLEAFKALLASTYVSGTGTVHLSPDSTNPCDVDKMSLIDFDDQVAGRLMRFEQLRRKTNLPIALLDSAIEHLGAGLVDATFLIKLAGAIELADQTGKSFEHLMTLWNAASNDEKKAVLAEITGFDTFNIEMLTHLSYPLSTLKTPKEILDFMGRCKGIKSLNSTPLELISMITGIHSWTFNGITVDSTYGKSIEAHIINAWNAISVALKSLNNAYADLFGLFNNIASIQKEIDELPLIADPADPDVISKIADLEKSKEELSDELAAKTTHYAYDMDTTILQSLSDSANLESAFMDKVLTFSDFRDWIKKTPISVTWSQWTGLAPNLQNEFSEDYSSLMRIAVLQQKTQTEHALLTHVFDHEADLDASNFAWLNKSFGANTIANNPLPIGTSDSEVVKNAIQKILWVKEHNEQSYEIGISQVDYYQQVITFQNNPISTQADADNRATAIRNAMDSEKWHKHFTEDQYQRLFTYAFSLTNGKDLVRVHRKAIPLSIYSLSSPSNIGKLWSLVWANTPFDPSIENTLDQNIINLTELLKADNTEAQWIKKNTKVNNIVRTNLRNALVSFYLNHLVNGEEDKNENALYARFLLDPKMEACMKTSRTKLAISGMQLIIHRAMMGLEPDLCPSEDNKLEWKWRENYRVWEANRKVFLYPENWIEPELRLDKSEFFEELEDSLLQDEINDENSEKAMQAYLTKLKEVARLDIRGTYWEGDGSNTYGSGTIHVIGRTFSTPYEYFYRKRLPAKQWTAWKKLELDIEGDHIIPVVHNRKLYLYWPMFIEKEHRKIKRVIEGEEQNAPYFEIRMCYSSLSFDKWSAKKILDGHVLAGHLAGKGCFNNLRYKLGQDIEQVVIGALPNPFWNPYWKPSDDPYGQFGPSTKIYGPYETDNGALVWSNKTYQDYAPVSMDKNKFFFWAEKNSNSGELTIHVRRDFDEDRVTNNSYTELAYEDSFKISACDDTLEIIPPVIEEVLFGEPTNNSRFIARPYNTKPDGQLMISDKGKEIEGPAGALYTKREITHEHGSNRLLEKTNGTYHLTHLNQYKHIYHHLPFFMKDDVHTLFFEKRIEERCVNIPYYVDQEQNTWYTQQYRNVLSKHYVQPHEHPYACLMLAEFNQFGIKGLLASKNPNNQLRRQKQTADYFKDQYQPVAHFIEDAYPIDEFDFSYLGAYQQYNWEIFFHAPSLIAKQLKTNGQYADAIKWLQFIFDPTNRDAHLVDDRFWMIKPFVEAVSQDSIQNLMHLLGATGLSPAEVQKREVLKAQIEQWKDNAFQPHKIAEMRHRAYMLWTVCEYIDVLIEWGDSLFRQDSIESINEASNLYVMAGEMLGSRPQIIEKPNSAITDSFSTIQNGLDAFSNVALNIENEMPAYQPTACCKEALSQERYQVPDLLFCIPDNPKLQELWNRTEDRLFKIRHCMNIDGQVRELPLFQPPIDPALLVRATAMGLDIGQVMAQINAPDPHYRYSYLLQKANEFTGEVKALGGQLLSALEKKDAEELSQIRQLHEQNILKASRNLKKMSIEEAKLGLASAQHSKKLIEIRLAEYEGRDKFNNWEKAQTGFMIAGQALVIAEKVAQTTASMLHPVEADLGIPCNTKKVAPGKVAESVAKSLGMYASISNFGASMSGHQASGARRQEDYDFQVKTAKEELQQVEKSILSAEIRVAIAEKDLENHDLQLEQSKEIYDFVRSKFTNLKLYSWMSTELMKLHRRAYTLAYEMAKQAERAMGKELTVIPKIIEFGHWDSSKKGLLAGEQLSMQLKELDNAYIKNDKRRFELSKDVSLKLLDPGALVNLIQHKYCKIELEEDLFNLVFQSRSIGNIQIKSIGISIPCVTGPQVSTNVKLRAAGGEELITSSGVNDMGVFEPNFNQAMYMPFEYLKLKEDSRDFLPLEIMLEGDAEHKPEYDLTTISDVVLHIRYYAENEGRETTTLPERASTEKLGNHAGLLMSWKHDFPMEWQKHIEGATAVPDTEGIDSINNLPSDMVPYKFKENSYSEPAMYPVRKIDQEMKVEGLTDPGDINTEDLNDIWLLYKVQ